jgi:hypothetical protein
MITQSLATNGNQREALATKANLHFVSGYWYNVAINKRRKQMSKQQVIDFTDWVETYKPLNDNNGEVKVYDTHSDWDFISTVNPYKVWTLVDSNEVEPVIVNGRAFVNRLEYYVTLQPWSEGDEIAVD